MDEQKGRIFASLFLIANRLQVLGDRLDERVTVKQWLLVAIIFKSGSGLLSIKEIARIVGATHQNVMQMVKSLKEKGFLDFFTDPKDRRIKRVSLTKKCLDYFQTRGDKELEFLNHLFADFSYEEIELFSAYIEKLMSNIEKMEKVGDEST